MCSCKRRGTKKELDRQKERRRFPEDRSQGTWSLPVYCHACTALTCVGSLIGLSIDFLYGFWSIHQLIPYEFRVYILQDRLHLHTKGFKCLLFNAWCRREACSKSIDSVMKSRGCFIVFSKWKVSSQLYLPTELELLAFLNASKYMSKTMCNERKRKNNSVVLWYFYVFACGSLLLFIKKKCFFSAFSLCVFAWGFQETSANSIETNGYIGLLYFWNLPCVRWMQCFLCVQYQAFSLVMKMSFSIFRALHLIQKEIIDLVYNTDKRHTMLNRNS